MATMVAKTATALSAIQDDLTPSITSGEININAALSFNGMPATSIGGATFVGGNSPTVPGSLYYSGGEFYAIDATGIVQLTLGGKISVTGIGGFTGDYGSLGVTAQARYTNSANLFQFFNGIGSSAIECGALILDNTSGGEQLRVDYTGTAAGTHSIHVGNLPSSGGATMLSINGATGTISTGPAVGTQQFDGVLLATATNISHTLVWPINVPLVPTSFQYLSTTANGAGTATQSIGAGTSGGGGFTTCLFPELKVGDVVASISVAYNGSSSCSITIFQDVSGSVSSITSGTITSTAVGTPQTITTVTWTVAANTTYYAQISAMAANSQFSRLTLNVTH